LVAWLLGKGAGTKNHTELRFAALAAGMLSIGISTKFSGLN
jgi:hypothetical protein